MAADKRLEIAGLEAVYDELAAAIDQVGAAATPLFLVKLALLLADNVGDEQVFRALLARALADLPAAPRITPSGE